MRKTAFSVISIITLILIFTTSCATNTAENLLTAPEVAEPNTETLPATVDSLAEPVLPQRYIKYEEVPRNGEYFVISNDTGYELVAVDIFTNQMYQHDRNMMNLLATETLFEQESRKIYLSQYPSLQTALQEQPESVFTLNAIDFEGDRYVQSWVPATDPWHIRITFESLDYTYEPPLTSPRESQIIVHNRTGVPLEHLYVSELTDEPNTDLLNSNVFVSGTAVSISTEAVPWIASQLPFDTYGRVLILAIDRYGNQYRMQWYPSSDPWDIVLTDEHLISIDFPDITSSVTISNQGDITIWYLFLVGQDTINALMQDTPWSDLSASHSDLLGDTILGSGEQLSPDIDLPSIEPTLARPLYLLGLDSDDRMYYQRWDDYTTLQIITAQSFIEIPQAAATYDYSPLSIDNQTGEELWFLYLMTESQYAENDEGPDMLDSMVLELGEQTAIVPESSAKIRTALLEDPETPIYIRAYSIDETLYEQRWSPDGMWSVVFTSQDRVE